MTSSSVSRYGRAASVDSWARRSFEAATNCIARVICLMFLADPMRRRISRWEGIATAYARNDLRNSSIASPRAEEISSVRVLLAARSLRIAGRSVSRNR